MGLIRLLFLLLILWVLWFMFRNWQRKLEMRETARREKAQIQPGKIVRCKHCDVHLPEQQALRDGETWFCTQAHQQAWLASSGNDRNST